MNPSTLFQAQCAAKRKEIKLRSDLGKALDPKCFRPDVAAIVKGAWLANRTTEGMIHREIVGTAIGRTRRGKA